MNEMKKKIIDDNHDKYNTNPEFNKLTAKKFCCEIKKANLVKMTDFNDQLKNLNKKNISSKRKHVLVEN